MNAKQIAEALERHRPYDFCARINCGQPWPCDAHRTLKALEETRKVLRRPMTLTDLREEELQKLVKDIQARHIGFYDDSTFCYECEKPQPCDARRLADMVLAQADTIERLEKALTKEEKDG